MKVLRSWFAAAMVLVPAVANAADDGANAAYARSFVSNGAHIVTAPFHLQPSDWWRNALVVAAIGGIYLLDDDIRDTIQDSRTRGTDRAAVRLRGLGDSAFLVPALGLSYLAGRALDSPKLQETSLLG